MPNAVQLLEYAGCIVKDADFLDSRPGVRLECLMYRIMVNIVISIFNRRKFDNECVGKPVLKPMSVKATGCVPRTNMKSATHLMRLGRIICAACQGLDVSRLRRRMQTTALQSQHF